MKRNFHWYDAITINSYWFALTARAQVLSALIVPLLVQQFVGEESKGAYLGTIRLWSLMAALVVQALMGLLSDRSRHPWGRRRPFILAGTLVQLVILTLIGFSAGLEGMAGYWVLFGLYLLSMVAADTAQAANQGLIPDLAPEAWRGRISGVKALLEVPIPLVFTALIVGKIVSAGNLWGGLAALMGVLVVCAVIVMFVREQKPAADPPAWDWKPVIRLALMTGFFTLIILICGQGVKWLGLLAEGKVLALVGLCAMSAATLLGVWGSVRIGGGSEILQKRSFIWWIVQRLAFMIPTTNLGGFIVFFIQEKFPDMALEKAAGPATQAIMFVGVFILVTAIPGGWLADRIGKKPVILAGGLLGALGTGGVVLFDQLGPTLIGACLIGAGVGLFYSASWALGTELVPREKAGQYLGLSNLAGAGAGAIGAYIGGPIADRAGYVLLYAIFGFLFLLSILPLIWIREDKS